MMVRPYDRYKYPIPAPLTPDDVTFRFERDFAAFRAVCTNLVQTRTDPVVGIRELTGRLALAVDEFMEVEQEATIPKRLLQGPYTWEGARTLFWLFRSAIALPYDDNWSWEVSSSTHPPIHLSIHKRNSAD